MVNSLWYTHTVQYYSAWNRRDILTHSAPWMNLEDSMLREISESQKEKYCIIPPIYRDPTEVARSWEKGDEGLFFNGCRISVLQIEFWQSMVAKMAGKSQKQW